MSSLDFRQRRCVPVGKELSWREGGDGEQIREKTSISKIDVPLLG